MTKLQTSLDPARLAHQATLLVSYAGGLPLVLSGALMVGMGAVLLTWSPHPLVTQFIFMGTSGCVGVSGLVVHRWRQRRGLPSAPAAMTPFIGTAWRSPRIIWLWVAITVLMLTTALIWLLMYGVKGWHVNRLHAILGALFALLVLGSFLSFAYQNSWCLPPDPWAWRWRSIALTACL